MNSNGMMYLVIMLVIMVLYVRCQVKETVYSLKTLSPIIFTNNFFYKFYFFSKFFKLFEQQDDKSKISSLFFTNSSRNKDSQTVVNLGFYDGQFVRSVGEKGM